MDIQELILGKRVKTLSIRIPVELWKKLRRMQEEGKIKSIQAAAIEGFYSVVRNS